MSPQAAVILCLCPFLCLGSWSPPAAFLSVPPYFLWRSPPAAFLSVPPYFLWRSPPAAFLSVPPYFLWRSPPAAFLSVPPYFLWRSPPVAFLSVPPYFLLRSPPAAFLFLSPYSLWPFPPAAFLSLSPSHSTALPSRPCLSQPPGLCHHTAVSGSTCSCAASSLHSPHKPPPRSGGTHCSLHSTRPSTSLDREGSRAVLWPGQAVDVCEALLDCPKVPVKGCSGTRWHTWLRLEFKTSLARQVHGGTRGYTLKASLRSRIHGGTRGYTGVHGGTRCQRRACVEQKCKCRPKFHRSSTPLPVQSKS